jgi:hypothetical protein
MIIVVKDSWHTATQLNISLQIIELCKLVIGVGQRTADIRIVVEIPTQK